MSIQMGIRLFSVEQNKYILIVDTNRDLGVSLAYSC